MTEPLTLSDVVAAVEALPEPTLGLKGGVNRQAVLDILQGYAYSLATEEMGAGAIWNEGDPIPHQHVGSTDACFCAEAYRVKGLARL